MIKTLSKVFFALYILTLLWLVLFKLSFDITGILLHHQSQSVNIIPFGDIASGSIRELIDNVIVFIPLGLMLGMFWQRINLWRKLAYIALFSTTIETLQFVLAIGATDITDVIANTAGGFIGLAAYDAAAKRMNNKALNGCIVIGGMVLLVALLVYRFAFIKVLY